MPARRSLLVVAVALLLSLSAGSGAALSSPHKAGLFPQDAGWINCYGSPLDWDNQQIGYAAYLTPPLSAPRRGEGVAA